jgi:hypothetical protein
MPLIKCSRDLDKIIANEMKMGAGPIEYSQPQTAFAVANYPPNRADGSIVKVRIIWWRKMDSPAAVQMLLAEWATTDILAQFCINEKMLAGLTWDYFIAYLEALFNLIPPPGYPFCILVSLIFFFYYEASSERYLTLNRDTWG